MCRSLGPALRAGQLYDPFLGTTPFSGHSLWSPAAVEGRPWRGPGARSPSASEPRRRPRRALAGGPTGPTRDSSLSSQGSAQRQGSRKSKTGTRRLLLKS